MFVHIRLNTTFGIGRARHRFTAGLHEVSAEIGRALIAAGVASEARPSKATAESLGAGLEEPAKEAASGGLGAELEAAVKKSTSKKKG